jgi:hypothetical protein
MKIIALYPLLKEELNYRFLQISILSLYNIVDQIIILIDFQNKELKFKKNIFKKKKIKIYYLNKYARKTNAPREALLNIGRLNKGTHFIWLDCDEAFTYPFSKNGREIISSMKVGEKIQMHWLSMWKKYNYFRVDHKSIWSNSFKDFIVCDDPNYAFNNNVLHEARTQGNNTKDNSIILDPSKGAVMHFQFVNWNNYRLKQAWYMCLETSKMKENINKTNRKYFYTYYENFPKLSKIKNNLIKHLPKKYLNKIYLNTDDYWKKKFQDFFKKNKIRNFEQLNIWNNIILKKIFFESENRYPNLNIFSKLNIVLFYVLENYRLLKKIIINNLKLKSSNY